MIGPIISQKGFTAARYTHRICDTAVIKLLLAVALLVSVVGAQSPQVQPSIQPLLQPMLQPQEMDVKPVDQGFYAIDFKDTPTTATYSDNLFDGLTAFTVEFWCYSPSSFDGAFWVWSDKGLGSAFFFDFGRLGVRLNNAASTASLGSMGTTDWQYTWFHVAFRWQQGEKPEILAWRDGVEYTQTTQAHSELNVPLVADGDTFYIGSNAAAVSFLNGKMTAIRLWDYKRTDEEVRADRTNPFASGDGLLVSWPIIDTDGQIIHDVSGNEHHLIRGLDETIEDLDPGTFPAAPWTEITADGPQ